MKKEKKKEGIDVHVPSSKFESDFNGQVFWNASNSIDKITSLTRSSSLRNLNIEESCDSREINVVLNKLKQVER